MNTSKKKAVGMLQVDHFNDEIPELNDPEFREAEAFMVEHGQEVPSVDEEEPPLSESEAAEALAVSWRERRQEIAKVSKTRQFGHASHGRFGSSAAGGAKKAFKVEIEELKRRGDVVE